MHLVKQSRSSPHETTLNPDEKNNRSYHWLQCMCSQSRLALQFATTMTKKKKTKLVLIYNFSHPRNDNFYVGEKHVGLDKKRQTSQKEHVLSLQRLCQLKLSTLSFAGLIPDNRSFNFPPTFACSFIAVVSFLVRFFRFFEPVHGHFHGLGLFIPKIITTRKMLAWWLTN